MGEAELACIPGAPSEPEKALGGARWFDALGVSRLAQAVKGREMLAGESVCKSAALGPMASEEPAACPKPRWLKLLLPVGGMPVEAGRVMRCALERRSGKGVGDASRRLSASVLAADSEAAGGCGVTLGDMEAKCAAAAAGVVAKLNASMVWKLDASSELAVTGRCNAVAEDPRVKTSEKLKRRPPGVVTVPPGVRPNPGVAGCTKNGRRSLLGMGIDMLAMVCARVRLVAEALLELG